jgi:hypothetical protein
MLLLLIVAARWGWSLVANKTASMGDLANRRWRLGHHHDIAAIAATGFRRLVLLLLLVLLASFLHLPFQALSLFFPHIVSLLLGSHSGEGLLLLLLVAVQII